MIPKKRFIIKFLLLFSYSIDVISTFKSILNVLHLKLYHPTYPDDTINNKRFKKKERFA